METPNQEEPETPKPTMRRICCITQAQTPRPRASMSDHLRAAAVWAQIFQTAQEVRETEPEGEKPAEST